MAVIADSLASSAAASPSSAVRSSEGSTGGGLTTIASALSPTHDDMTAMRRSSSSLASGGSSSTSLSTSLGASQGGMAAGVAGRRRVERVRMLIVRHGETDYNVQGIIQGQMDTDLNDVGRQQAQQVAAALAKEHVDEVYASPLRRARDTATAIVRAHPNHRHGRLAYWLDDRLKERGFGVLEGKTFDRRKPKRDSMEGIEQMSVFAARLASFVADASIQPAPFTSSEGQREDGWVDDVFDGPTRPAASADEIDLPPPIDAVGPPPNLNRGGCTRTIVVAAHGAAISALVGAVLLDTGLACMSAGVQRTRVWNCSITEVIIEDVGNLPRTAGPRSTFLDMQELAARPGKKEFVIERWADVRHLPENADDAAAVKGSADEMIGRQTVS